MTLREYVEKKYPHKVDDIFTGGVCGCPTDYDHINYMGKYCNGLGGGREFCTKCWNRELKDIVMNEKNENVEHPSHYNAHNIEVIDFIQDWELNFCLGNVIKYVCRSPYKGTQIEDLKKAREYLDFEIKRLEKE